MTPIPGVVLPPPAVFRANYTWGRDGWADVHLSDEFVDVPERAYQYELADVDLRDASSLAELAGTLGALLVPVGTRPRWSDTTAVEATAPGAEDRVYWDRMAGLAQSAALPSCDRDQLGPFPERRLHVVELAARVWDIKVMSGVHRDELQAIPWGGRGPGFPDLPSSVSINYVAHRSALLLGVFSPHLATGSSSLAHRATALEVATLQLFNEVVRGQAWKVCLFCHRPFTMQRGRARHGPEESHRRSDAKYCQKRCANAAAQAKHRARARPPFDGTVQEAAR